MKSVCIISSAVLVGLQLTLVGCSPEAQQAAPHVIVSGIAKLSGAKKGFFVTDGRPTYHDWNAGDGNIAKPLEGADAASFHAFDHPKGARILYARDRNYVYVAECYTPCKIKGADAKSFQIITHDGVYAKDAKHVYFLGVPIVDADPSSFEILMYPFSQDKEHAFVGAAPIHDVDRASWCPLRKGWTDDHWYRSARDTHPQDQESAYVTGWSCDANAFYYGRKTVNEIDVVTFEVLSDYYAKDKNHVYSRYYYDKLAIIQDADPVTFMVHENVDDILKKGQGADAHDAKFQYRSGKVLPLE